MPEPEYDRGDSISEPPQFDLIPATEALRDTTSDADYYAVDCGLGVTFWLTVDGEHREEFRFTGLLGATARLAQSASPDEPVEEPVSEEQNSQPPDVPIGRTFRTRIDAPSPWEFGDDAIEVSWFVDPTVWRTFRKSQTDVWQTDGLAMVGIDTAIIQRVETKVGTVPGEISSRRMTRRMTTQTFRVWCVSGYANRAQYWVSARRFIKKPA